MAAIAWHTVEYFYGGGSPVFLWKNQVTNTPQHQKRHCYATTFTRQCQNGPRQRQNGPRQRQTLKYKEPRSLDPGLSTFMLHGM